MTVDSELPLLWQLRFSHFNEKARWALDYKRVPHRRRSLLPGSHPRKAKKLSGGPTTPVLVLDGRGVGDTTAIIASLENRNPEPALYPDTEIDREAALELEEFFDEELGPHIRRAIFHACLPHPEYLRILTQGFNPFVRGFIRVGYPLVRRSAVRQLAIDDAGAELGRAKTVEALDRIESELSSSGYLVGDTFSVADLTAAALLFPLVCPPEFPYFIPDHWPDEWEDFRRPLADRPAYKWALEMFKRHRGSSAAISDD